MSWFSFTDASGEAFTFRLNDAALAAEARAILDGTQTGAIHIAGIVEKSAVAGNIGWSFHLDPESIFFFEISAEVGDSTMRLIENDLEAVGGAFLPGSLWTGWSSQLTAELNVIRGSAAADELAGGAEDDLIMCGSGGDMVAAGRDRDHVTGGVGDDVLRGGAGGDKLDGNTGDDRIAGGDGRDVLAAGGGDDRLNGGNGADTFMIAAPQSNRTVTIADFDSLVVAERIHLDRSWLDGLSDNGKANRHDLIAAFENIDGDLVYATADGARLIIANAAAVDLIAADFWLT